VDIFATEAISEEIFGDVIEEEKEGTLAHAAQRAELLDAHLPQVRCIARRIHARLPPHVPLEDMVHAGVLGLMDALGKYDPERKVPLKCYAEYRIRGAIVDSLRESDWGPRKLRHKGRRMDQAIAQCKSDLGRDPSEAEVAVKLDVSLDELRQLRRDLRNLNMESLESETMYANGEKKKSNRSGPHEEGPYHQALRSEMAALLASAIGELSAREQEVLALYDFEELTMGAIGTKLRIGESRVSQIHTGALARLRTRMRRQLGKRKSVSEVQARRAE